MSIVQVDNWLEQKPFAYIFLKDLCMPFSSRAELMEYCHVESTRWAAVSHNGSNQVLESTPVLDKKQR